MNLEELKYKMISKATSNIKLNKKQNEAFNIMVKEENIFITGPGGVGKSAMIKLFVQLYKHKRIIGVTSTTGISALSCGGTTLHSYLGIGLGTSPADILIKKICMSSFYERKWTKLETLIIDEISMLSPELFDKLDFMAKAIRKNDEPFGGIQLILSGDWCFGANTKILMASGIIKNSQDIKINDELMGDDGTSRIVTKLFQGKSNMFKIDMSRGGETFTVTGNHILCFKSTIHKCILWFENKKTWIVYFWYNNNIKTKSFHSSFEGKEDVFKNAEIFKNTLPDYDVIELSVNKYITLPKNTQEGLTCYKVPINIWPNKKVKNLVIHPWLLGAWLGDENSNGKGYTNIDTECKNEFDKYLKEMNCLIQKSKKLKYKYVIKHQEDKKCSPFKDELKKYNLINNKHIPDDYLYSTIENRLELLAGLLDTDSHLLKNTYQISQTQELSTQICFLAHSIGLRCTRKYIIKKGEKEIHGYAKLWLCKIKGDIPCRIIRKKFSRIKNVLNPSSFIPLHMKIKVTPLDIDNFYGFETTGNKRFLLGDFTVTHNCQLPVVKNDKFCFESKAWESCVTNTVYLDEIIRQQDPVFQKCLNSIRLGNVTQETRKLLESRVGVKLENNLGIKPTKLYSTNDSADYINRKELNILAENGEEVYEYNMENEISPKVRNKDYLIEKHKKFCSAVDKLQLCKNAQVILIYNLDIEQGLVNGSRGVVIGFMDDLPIVKFINNLERIIDYNVWDWLEDDKKVGSTIQIPLKLAWAMVFHRIQGLTLDYAEIDLTNLFECGMGYVALSRVKHLEGLTISGIDFDKITANPKALNYYKKLKERDTPDIPT
jgi:hypothetical protein